jgi:carbamate kinase
VITRVLVDPADAAWSNPTKPIGRFVPEAEARERIAAGEVWEERGERGWRRVVASPDPLEILDRGTVERLIAAGAIVVAAGGGGIPMVRDNGRLRGVEAVLDKDLTGALLARTLGADCFMIATDVEAAAIRFGTPEQEWLGEVSPRRLRALVEEGHFASGSMGPKVEAALRFVEAGAPGGRRAVITTLERVREGVEGTVGTRVRAER